MQGPIQPRDKRVARLLRAPTIPRGQAITSSILRTGKPGSSTTLRVQVEARFMETQMTSLPTTSRLMCCCQLGQLQQSVLVHPIPVVPQHQPFVDPWVG